jgi:hypothetical protein
LQINKYPPLNTLISESWLLKEQQIKSSFLFSWLEKNRWRKDAFCIASCVYGFETVSWPGPRFEYFAISCHHHHHHRHFFLVLL